jgi:hypothetical protein
MHPVEASAPTGAAAERALTAKLGRLRVGSVDEIGPDTRLDVLCARTMDEKAEQITPQSLVTYQSAVTRIVEGLGKLPVREVTTGRIDRFLTAVPAESTRKRCRVILADMLGMAMRHDAINRNPVTDAGKAPRTARKKPRSLSATEARALRDGIREWVEAPEQPGSAATSICRTP